MWRRWREDDADDRALTARDRVVRGVCWSCYALGLTVILLLGLFSDVPAVWLAVACVTGGLIWVMVFAAVVVRQRGRARRRRRAGADYTVCRSRPSQ